MMLANPGSVWAGSVLPLPHVCEGGPNAGQECFLEDDECPNSVCVTYNFEACKSGPRAGQTCVSGTELGCPDSVCAHLPRGACEGGPNRYTVCQSDTDCPRSKCSRVAIAPPSISTPFTDGPTFPFSCRSGPGKGIACVFNENCPKSKCSVEFLHGLGTEFTATITFIVDDDVSVAVRDRPTDIPSVIAVTVLVEIDLKGGERSFFAQTYQGLTLDKLDFESLIQSLQVGPIGLPNKEEAVERDIADGRLIELLNFSIGDSEMAQSFRDLFGVKGEPVIVGVSPKEETRLQYSNRVGDHMASVFRFKAQIRFIIPLASF